MVRSAPALLYVVANVAILIWDLLVASWTVQTRRRSEFFAAVTALAGLLVVPGVLVALAAGTLDTGRIVHIIEVLWPLAVGACLLQSASALLSRSVAPALGVAVTALNLVLFAAAAGRFAAGVVEVGPFVSASGGAHASALGFVFGRAALVSPFAIQVPALVPVFPARFRIGRPFRFALALWAAATVMLFAMEYPRAVRATATFDGFGDERLQERPRGDLAIGLRILPAIALPPPAPSVVADLELSRQLGADVVAVLIQPRGATTRVLDSLSRGLETIRRDGARLMVTLGYDRAEREKFRRDADGLRLSRLRAIDRIVTRLGPEVLFPALDPYTAGAAALGSPPPRWWRAYLRDAAAAIKRAAPATEVGVAISAFTAPDSSLYVWASSPETSLDVLAFSLRPSYGGGASLRARFHLAERWMRSGRKPHWIITSGANPRLHGERNHAHSLWGTLAWATRQPLVRGFIVDGAGDYETLTGLRAPGGRVRPAFAMLVRAKRALGGVD